MRDTQIIILTFRIECVKSPQQKNKSEQNMFNYIFDQSFWIMNYGELYTLCLRM